MGSSKRGHHGNDGPKKTKRHKKDKKKHKRERKATKRCETPSDSSESDDGRPDFIKDAQDAPVAADYVRAILRAYPSMKVDFRELLWKVDNEEGVRIDGLPDAKLKGALRGLFTYLNLRHTKQGTYALRQGQDKVLRRIGAVFQERIPDESHLALRLPGGPSADPPVATAPAHCAESPQEAANKDMPERIDSAADDEAAPRVKGPAAPSEALRRAAADAAAAMRSQGLLDNILEGVSEQLVGPVPEGFVAQMDGAAADQRGAQVERILEVVAKHERLGLGGAPDAYSVLDIPPDSSTTQIKKQFWKISLLIHPDKCSHEQAGQAFDVVKKTAQALQDGEQRGAIDAARQSAADEALNRRVMTELERERKWRILQGTATAEDLAGEIKPAGPVLRDTWMTEAPEVKAQAPAYMEQKSVSAFSQSGVTPAAMDATWTALPGAAPSHLLTAGSGATVQPLSKKDALAQQNAELLRIAAAEKAQAACAARGPALTLIEQHQQDIDAQQRAVKKRAKERKQTASAPEAIPQAAKGQAWVPFDREKDLQAPTSKDTKSKYQSMLDGDSSLSARFHK